MKREQTRSIGEVIGDFIKESDLGDGLLQARVFEAWGLLSAGQVRPGDYTSWHSFKDGVLTCKINSSVVRSHLSFQTDIFRRQINKMLQEEVVKQIKLV